MSKKMTDLFQPIKIKQGESEDGRPYLSIDGSRTYLVNGGDTPHVTQNTVPLLRFMKKEKNKYKREYDKLKKKTFDLRKKLPMQEGDFSLECGQRQGVTLSYKDWVIELLRKHEGLSDEEIEKEIEKRTVPNPTDALLVDDVLL